MDRAALISVVLALMAPMGVSGTDQQWPQFRGPNAGAVADDPSLPDRWSETENVLWKTAVPGQGWSSPIVWDDHIFLTSAVITSGKEAPPVPGLYDENGKTRISAATAADQRWMVYDIDFQTGKMRWQRELHHGTPLVFRHVKNSYASETPVTDGERLYVYFGSIGLVAALDFDGDVLWTKDIGAFNTNVDLGTGASPVLHRDRLYIVSDNTVQSFLLALDARTGAEIWKVDREERGNWSTPVVWENASRTEIVTTGTRKVRSYDLNGNLLWELAGMSEFTVPSPFVKHGLVYISSGYPGGALRPVYAIRPGASGDVSLRSGETSNDYVVWHQPLLGTYNTSALVYGNYYYTLLERGFLLCHDARTGAQVYGRQRISVGASGFTASPWAYNGKIFVLSEDGDTFVIQAGPEFKLIGKNSLGEMPLATPAIVRGSVLIRTASTLYRIAETKR
jgi:outer membrane protein assembly factor BamB